jgi:hypothetical protein
MKSSIRYFGYIIYILKSKGIQFFRDLVIVAKFNIYEFSRQLELFWADIIDALKSDVGKTL